jgi:FkbM family methyltransferase
MGIPSRVKQRLVGTKAGNVLRRARATGGQIVDLRRSPELAGLIVEERWIDLAVRRLMRPGVTGFDGGAHLGSMTAAFVQCAPGERHLTVEALPDKAAWLRRRWPSVEVHAVALGESPGEAVFYEDIARSGYSSLARGGAIDGDKTKTHTVPVDTVDRLVAGRHIGFMKLDVEGAELLALRGGIETVARCSPSLLLECGVESSLEPFGYERTDLWDFVIGDLGYHLYLVSDFVFGRNPMGRDEFKRAGTYPFPGFNYIGLPADQVAVRIA